MKNNCLIFDFDSTIVSIETLDYLIAKFSSDNHEMVEKITNQAMSGKINFSDSLKTRFSLMKLTKENIDSLKSEICDFITKDFSDLISQASKSYDIFIVSGGFLEIIYPVADYLGVKKENCFANNFCYQDEKIIGFEDENVMAKNGGKIVVVREILAKKKYQKIFMIGDGSTDLEVSKAIKEVNFCYAAFHIQREAVISEIERINEKNLSEKSDKNSGENSSDWQIFKVFYSASDLQNFLQTA